MPLNFNFEKRILKNIVVKRKLPEINIFYNELGDDLLK
jgi:hypothetical protein